MKTKTATIRPDRYEVHGKGRHTIETHTISGGSRVEFVIFAVFDPGTQRNVDVRVHWTQAFSFADGQESLPEVKAVKFFSTPGEWLTYMESWASGRFGRRLDKAPRLDRIVTLSGGTLLRRLDRSVK